MTLTTIEVRKGARVYIVENSEERLKWFFAKLPNATVMHQKDPGIAVYQLRLEKPESFDCIFLDFDLGPGNVRNSTINSIPVVDFLNHQLTSRKSQRNIVIHSQNAPGAFWINTLLPGAAQLPFGTFDIKEVPNVLA